MARKKRSRLTLKKSTKNKEHKAPPDGLTEAQFKALKSVFGSFIVTDGDGQPHEFKLNNTAFIVPYQEVPSDDLPLEDHWIGRIREIRANTSEDVWVKVQWYWSPQEVAEVIKSFNPEHCGKKEKLFSDNYDIVSSQCFSDLVLMKRYDERDLEQPQLEDDDWFYRYNFEYTARRIIPKVATITCVCKTPYIPGSDEILHFCPRPGCRTAHHQSCLLERGLVEDVSEDRYRRLIETWPEVGATDTVESVVEGPSRKRRKGTPSSTDGCPVMIEDLDPLESFPRGLLDIAKQQIVKGTHAGGIVGNLAAVTAARNIIFRALTGDGIVPDDWMVEIDMPSLDIPWKLPGVICPHCGSPI
ncbi:hypothetical protein HYDPIDRAFT_40999 [Hydnomerulius pinastri MD-312]|uniref:BAH domain-containing protein n=1 Tax=Hydnomerulius pinastri MD-312 TaxID=994086 RepID=A0A0C9VYY5_9AGAM|nr:hypothetical protein HYDPIDRAFT_40999 [Hydnomerulius pinastri MD-312]